MPLLSDDDLQAMRNSPLVYCHRCGKQTRCNYCRECDKYFRQGHMKDCEMYLFEIDHEGHRTY